MQTAFELATNVVEIGIILDFLNRYFGFKYDPPKCYLFCVLIHLTIFTQLSVLNYCSPFSEMATYVAVVLFFVYAYFCLMGETVIKFFISVFVMTAVMLIANGCILLMSDVLDYDPNLVIVVFGPVRIAVVIITKAILFYLTRILLHVKQQPKLEFGDILPLIIIPSISLLGITFMMKAAYRDPKVQQIVLYAVLIILSVNLITYYLFVRISKESRAKTEHLLLQQQYEFVRQSIHEVGLMYQEMRATRHDLKNHLLSISILLQKQDFTRAQNYVSQLLQQHDATDFQLLQTGNEVLDAVLGIKLAVCRKEKITVLLNVQDTLSFMKPTDISALFANLMDNATEACRNSEARKIELTIVPQHPYIGIIISNSIQSSVLMYNPQLSTTKPSKAEHGFGIRNIKRIAAKYNGMIDFFEEDNRFFFEILLERGAK